MTSVGVVFDVEVVAGAGIGVPWRALLYVDDAMVAVLLRVAGLMVDLATAVLKSKPGVSAF